MFTVPYKERVITMTKTSIQPDVNCIGGIWKFRVNDARARKPLALQDIIDLALELRASEPDRYVELYVRSCGTDQIGIGFRYFLPEKGSMKRYIGRMTDLFRQRYGNGLVGWDISDQIFTIIA